MEMPREVIDFRSDTVTRPTSVMRQRMAIAHVGDDVMGDDPMINELQKKIADMFRKESALFFPSGTMCNLASVFAWCEQRGAEIIVGEKSHMFLFEQAGVSQFGGVSMRTVPNLSDGSMDLESVRLAIRDDNIHEPFTRLIAIENTHNACGGTVLPTLFLQEIRKLSDEFDIPIHMDGARVWNALTATGQQPHEISRYVDSLSVCFSKGLGAPIGSVLIGPQYIIDKAKRIRKALGGGMRQVGILGAAALQALEDFEGGVLIADHRRANMLADGIKKNPVFKIDPQHIDTNIIFVKIDSPQSNSTKIWEALKEMGVLISIWSPYLIRLVVHRDITDEDIHRTIKIFGNIAKSIV